MKYILGFDGRSYMRFILLTKSYLFCRLIRKPSHQTHPSICSNIRYNGLNVYGVISSNINEIFYSTVSISFKILINRSNILLIFRCLERNKGRKKIVIRNSNIIHSLHSCIVLHLDTKKNNLECVIIF